MTRTSRNAFLFFSLTTLVAACLFAVALFAQSAQADVVASATSSTSYSDLAPGSHPDLTIDTRFQYSNGNGNGNSGDDLKRLAFDWPAGVIGDPNAIIDTDRCPIDYSAGSPPPNNIGYNGCNPESQIGTVTAYATASAWVGECTMTLTGKVSLLGNQPTYTPEVPAYVGIHVAGTPSGLCSIVGVQRMNMTAKITLRPSDNGLRMEILDDLPYQHATGNILAGTVPIRITRIVQNIDGMAPSPSTKPFLTAPTRCSNWDITTYTAGYQANTIPYTSDLFPVDGVLDSAAATESATPNCTTIPALNTGFTMAMTNNQAGRPVGVRATVTNTVPTDSTSQGAYAKIFKMTLPVGYKINPAIANRLGANGCISDDFFRPIPGQAVSETAPSCLPGTQVGTVAVKAPEVTGDLVGKVYLGDPLAGDEAGGIYRLYVYAARAGVVTKFQGTAVANPVNGQVVVTMDNNGLGLPQFNYSSFILDFDTNSAGVGSPSSGAIASPNDNQQMLVNPQVCGSYTHNIQITPWTSANQGIWTPGVQPTSTITAGTNGACAFNAFAPTFNANVSTTQAGRHPDLTLTVTRGDRQDNLKNLAIKLPSGFAGSAAVVPKCTLGASDLGDCDPLTNKVGTAAVTVGLGPETLNMPTSDIYNVVTDNNTQTAKLGIATHAQVGPFDLGYVISYTIVRLDNASTFRLATSTDLMQSIKGIPINYRTVALTLFGSVGSVPFLTNPSSVCAAALDFQASITSNGDAPSAGPSTVVPVDPSIQNLNCTTTPQPFSPTIAVSPTTLATAQPTGLTLTLSQSQTAAVTQQSTISGTTVTMPIGLELNPGFAQAVTACPTATINTDITLASNNCTGVATKIADVTVNTPLLPSAVTGQVYLEQPGGTPATRYRLVMYLDMPGGRLIIRGSVTHNGATAGGVSGSTGSTNGAATGQLAATFTGLPDVPWSSMALAFNSATPMFVNSDAIATQQFNASFNAYSTSSTSPATASASYLTNFNGTVGSTGTTPFNPTFSQSLSLLTPNSHPDLTMTVNRPEKNEQLSAVKFSLPQGLTGAPAAVPTCTQVQADAAACPANTRIGSVTTGVGSALVATPSVGLASLTGSLYNTAPAGAIAKFTAVVPVILGPFNLGSMTLPVSVAMRPEGDPLGAYGLDASVTLPNRYEGVKIRYRSLQVVINGVAPGNGANFLTNPSSCGAKTTTATMTPAAGVAVPASQVFTIAGCTTGFTTPPTISVATNPATPAAQTPIGITANINSAVGNPTMKQIKITMPPGVSLNAAVGNNGVNTTCSTANINADTCGAATVYGTASMTTPLLSGGPFTGNIYLETPTTTGNPDERYRVAMIISLPGQKLIVRGKIRVNGDSTVTAGGLGTTDVGTGIVTADFDNLPDLAFSNFNVAFNTGSRAVMIAPNACSATNAITGQMYPYSSPATNVSNSSNFSNNSPCVPSTFNPTFSASVTSAAPAANPDLTMTVTNAGANVDTLRNVTYHMPTGFVANTNNVARCTQAVATAGNCATPAVGTASITVGTASEGYVMSGSVYNVTPNASEPARLQAVIPINIGPFVLGKFSAPVSTSLRADYGIDASASLPILFEGIDARVRALSVTLSGTVGGQPFFQNPSTCGSSSFSANLGNGTVTPLSTSPAINITPCPKNFNTSPTLGVSTGTTVAGDPTSVQFTLSSAANNPTIKRVQVAFPNGMEINPSFANGLTACPTATIDAGTCSSTIAIGSVSLTTPLLSTSPVTGYVYLETPGTTAGTRYRAAMIVDLPGRKLIVRGAINVNGSTTIAAGATGAVDSGTGKITADFNNIPDLGFTSLVMNFNNPAQLPGNPERQMVVNPETCTAGSFDGTFTNNSAGTDATSNVSYSSTGCTSTFDPSFTASVNSVVPNGHPNLTLNVARADKQKSLKTLAIHLPTGLVANTTAVATPCSQASAAAATCATTAATSAVGTFTTSFGQGTGTYNLTGGSIYQVTPNASEPARFAAIIPVVVGPFDLGKMTIPVSSSIRADYGIDINATIPQRYEGIAVRLRTLNMTLNGTVNSANYITNPSKCQANAITADFTAADTTADANLANNTSSFTTTPCSPQFSPNPSATVSGISTTTQTPTGMTVVVASGAGNPSIGQVRVTLPAGMSLNPAVGKNGANTTCSTALINAGGSGCPAQSLQGTVAMTTPLIPGTFNGNVYLEDPGATAADRFKLAIVVALPGRDMIIRGVATVNGATDSAPGATGAVDSGTGVVTADFTNIPDLAFSNLSLTLNSGARALLVTPSTCAAGWSIGTLIAPNGGGTTATGTQSFNTTINCTQAFAPTFSASVSSTGAGANADLTMSATNPGATVDYLRTVNFHLPTGFVANTNNVPRCTQALAAAANCAAANAVGSATADVGTNAEQLTLSGGTVYNVAPTPVTEPARLQVVIPVIVGPYNLGKLTIPVTTSIRSDYGIDAVATLPRTYEGIDIRLRSLSVTLLGTVGGQPFMQNPSVCQTVNNFNADLGTGSTTVNKIASPITINGCAKPFLVDPVLSVSASTPQAADPVGLTFGITSSSTNPTMKRVQIAFPSGMEINPAFVNGLNVCTAATVAGCAGATSIATVSLTTPLLSTGAVSGNVYVVSAGGTAATRYRVVMIVNLPSQSMVIPGSVTVNGSTDIPTAATGTAGSIDSGTGQINADFNNIPDLGFTNLSLAFTSGANAMVVNPDANTSASFTGTFTNNSGGADKTSTAAYTTSGAGNAFDPVFTASASSYAANAHPTLTMDITRADKQKQLKNLTIHFPAGLTANTSVIPTASQCTQASAAASTCASTASTSQVGTLSSVTIGSGTAGYTLTGGKIFEVVPNASEPARFQAIVPVLVGPYNLGNLSVPISGSLRASDYGIDLATTLPVRYEGIAVRIKAMQLVINGTVNTQSYINNPSKCTVGTISADMRAADNSNDSNTANNSSAYTATGCPAAFSPNPSVAVTGINTAAQTATGMNVSVTSAASNPTIGDIKVTLPVGMSFNPAIGNNGANTTCATAVIDAITTTTDACPAASQQGTVTLTSALLNGTFNGKVYLESPGTTAATRYKLAIVIALPGQMLITHGSATVDGSTTIPTGGTGSKDTGTGQIVVEFPSIPDLAFTNMTMTLPTTSKAMLVTPSTCAAGWSIGTSVSPNGGGAAATGTQTFSTTTNCTQAFSPTFSASLSDYTAGANPDLTINVTNGGSSVNQLRNVNIKLPVGLVANTNALARCTQASATAGTCGSTHPTSAVGTITTSMGTAAETLALSGTVYNVVPSASEPARLVAIIPVLVGPYNLGNLPVDITTALNDGVAVPARKYAVDTFSTLPQKYEGIDVRVRALGLVIQGNVSGQKFMINPSACSTTTIGADLKTPDPFTQSLTSAATFTGCNRPYATDPTFDVTPSTTAAGQPVGLTFDMGSTLANPTTKAIKLTFPAGFELNPATGTGLVACTTAQIDAGGAACDATTANLGDVTLTTPLLTNPQLGKVYLETPGNAAGTRYKVAIVVHLPGTDLIVRGAITINGSSTIPTGGTGAVDSGTGQITADFTGIPDLGFTNLNVAFKSGSQALFVNPQSCSAASITADWTPHGTGAVKSVSDGYTPDTNCSNPLAFAPTFNGSAVPATSAGNPDVTLGFTRPDNNRNLRNLVVSLPTGLVANTTATTTCAVATAAAGNCAANQIVGTVSTAIGSGPSTFSLSGSLYNVAANPATEPARFAAVMPVQVGPFDLGKLSIPVTTSLRSDLGVDAAAQLPTRYEGIAVRIRTLTLVLAKTANGNPFMINPSKCQSNAVNASMTSDGASPSTVTSSFAYSTTGCTGFTSAPSLAVAGTSAVPADPTGLTFTITSAATNPTMKRVQLTFPSGMEINPAFGTGLTACTTANIDAGGAACAGSSQLATVSMVTPLLASNPSGKVFLESAGNTALTRYKVAMIVDLPGQKLIVRGAITVNGSTDIPTASTGATGSLNSGTGQITADFDNIPDLGFTSLAMAFNGGPNAMVVNPETCANSFSATFTPNSSTGTTSSSSPSYPLSGGCPAFGFDPAFSASVDNTTPAGHPNLTLTATRADKQKTLKSMNIHLPTGLVANTSAVATTCTQASAAAASCAATAATSEVGAFTTTFGSGTATYSLAGGKIYQVTPNANEPVRFAAIVPVQVGPYNLGNLTIPVSSSIRADYGIDVAATLPQRYEGIAVRLRSLAMTLNSSVNSQSYITNPSKCQTNTVSADFTAGDNSSDTSAANNSSTFTTSGCSTTTPPYNPTITSSVNPTTAGNPTALTLGVNLPAGNASTNRVQVALPVGMELNPGVGNGLVACPTIDSDSTPSNPCKLTSSNIATITLNTPLLPGAQTGEVYLETPGNTAGTRYKLALVIHLPGKDLLIHGSTLVNGSTTVPTGGLGSTDSAGTATGQVTADFQGLPDLGFTSMSIAFNSGSKLFVNPKTASTFTVNGTLTPNSVSSTKSASSTFTTTGGTTTVPGFNPTFSAALSTSNSASNPNLTLNLGNPLGMQELKSFAIKLPVGLVANTTAVTRCSQVNADAGNCAAANFVGTAQTTFGSSNTAAEDYTVNGSIYNVIPNNNQPARLQAVVPVQVGPFDLGKLSIPVPTSLNSDLTVTANASLPSRYEGIAVRVRAMQLVIQGQPNGNKFMVAPTKCGASDISALMTSDTGTPSTILSPINIVNCGQTFGASPAFSVTPSTTVRTQPVDLGFQLTSAANNPTIGRVQVAMPTGMEINPGFATNLAACSKASIDAGGSTCPVTSQLGTVSLKTQLLDPTVAYTGKVYLETPEQDGAKRYKIAIVVALPGADLVLHGKVSIDGTSTIPTGGTGATDTGTGQVIADFDTIPDLGFTELNMQFSTTNPLMINPQTCTSNTFTATITPSSLGANATPTSAYTTTPAGCSDAFSPNFSVSVDGGSSTASAGHPDLNIHIDRPAGTNALNQRYLRQLNLDLPIGLVAATTATTHCQQVDANAGNCAGDQLVGAFDTWIGNGAADANNLNLAGQIYNVEPNVNEPARLAAITDVQVGPYNLGKLVIPIGTTLNPDLTVSTTTTIPRRYEGIAVRIKKLDIDLFGQAPSGNPFISVPSKCQSNTVTAHMTSDVGTVSNKTSAFTTTGCPQPFQFTPTVGVTSTPTDTTVPTGLGVTIGSDARNGTMSRLQLTLPPDMSINADAGNGLATCSTANINAGGASCPASSNQGSVTLNTPLLGNQRTGNVYLEDPGSTGATRYKLAIVVHLPGTDLILRGKVLVNGSSDVTGGLGATDTGTGRITTDFDTIPDLAFTQMVINFNTGNRALLTNPDTCGPQTVNTLITPSAGGADANINSTFTTTNTLGCSPTKPFNPTLTVTQASSTSGANTDLTLDVTAGAKNEYLKNFNLHLPVGLVADTTATTTTCTQAQAAAATCTAASRVGTLTTKLGTGGETLDLQGSIYNVVPNSSEPARLAAIVPVVVGPYDLGKLTIPVPTSLRGSDYGVDATTQIPFRYEGISVRLAQMTMKLFGAADQGTLGNTADDKGFIKNPSKCDLTGSTNPLKADFVPLTGSTVARTVNYVVDGCPRNFSPNPTLTLSNTTNTTAAPTGMTLQFDSAASNPTIGSVVTTMPLGMTLNPAVANLNGGISACPTATITALQSNPNAPACPAASKVGDVSLVTPLLPGTKTGSIYLEEPGNTAATRYKLVMVVDLPGTKLIVRGATTVDGSSDISGGVGATDLAGPNGRIVANFASIPDLGFTQLKIAFSGGPDALFTNSETAGTQTVAAQITPQSGGSTITANGTFTTTYGGPGVQASEPFSPNFSATFSTTDAAANPDVGITVTRPDYTQQLRQFDLHLPPGLVANTVLTPRCSQANAIAGTCGASSKAGTVSTKIGTGSDQLAMSGTLFNVVPDASEPARLAAVFAVQVGPYNLGKLSLPVSTEIVSGAQASDLSINTHTTIPKWYEGVPVRIRELKINILGKTDPQLTPGNPNDDVAFMINPSQCTLHTLTAEMTSTTGTAATGAEPFTTTNCANAPYNPAMTAALSTTQRGKPVGIDLGFQFSGNSSSTKKIVTTFPHGMAINPGLGTYGAGMTCPDATVQAGGAGCPASSKLGAVTLDTPLLPTQQQGALYLLPPVGNQAATRYRLGLFVDLDGSGDLYTTGSVTVDGSSNVPTGGTGAVDAGDGQVIATFDNLPDLQFNNLTLHFKTTGAGEHALLTNPTTCGTFAISAAMNPWARPATSTTASTNFTTTDIDPLCPNTQNSAVTAEIGDNNPAGPSYFAGTSQNVTLTVNRPDSDKSIKRVKFLLPPGLVGSADAAPTCTQASADAGTCGTTEPGSQIGTTALKIGDSSDTYLISGGLFNTVAPSNRPAKFTFIADVNVGPFAFGKVIVPVDVNLDNNDFSLFAETGDMPQVFEGIPVRISQLKVSLVGVADQGTPSTADDKNFMSNPRSCSATLSIRAVITAPDSTTQNATAPLAGPFTNCGNLNLNANTVTIENQAVAPETGHGPEHPTGLNVQVHQNEALATQATLKNLTLALPGFRLSAPAANGLQACTALQLDNQACPADSRVGTAWIDTSLLPKNQTSPDGPGTHSLWGAVYLETPGNASDGHDRYKLAIQLTGKTLITIRGTAVVNETTGEITTTFSNLPDIPFTDFRVELTGYKKTVASTTQYFPLLLNPVGVVGAASSVQADADLTPWSGTPNVTRSSTLPLDAAITKTFTPSTVTNITPLTSGSHPTAQFTISRGDGQQDIKDVTMQLPAGFLGSAAAVPLCPVSSASAGNCTDSSKVGDVTAKIGQFGQTLTLPGKVYLTEGINGDIAGMSIKVPAKAGPYDLGDFITQGRILVRPSDHGITVNFVDVPQLFKGVPTHIQNMDIVLPGVAQSTQKPFLYNASDCSAFDIITTLTPYVGTAASDHDAYQATGCASRTFAPSMSFAANGGDERTAPAWTIKLGTNQGDSTLKGTTVTLPSVMTVNVQGLGSSCTADQANARQCPAGSKIGTVSVNTPLLSSPVTGTVYMARSISGSSLPDLLLDIPAPIDMQIRGANRFVGANNNEIQSTFSNLPDLIWSDMTMSIIGGPTGLLGLRDDGKCGSASAAFASHSGQNVNSSIPVTGLTAFCGKISDTCANPVVKVSTKGAKKKGNKKAATSLSLQTASNCQAMKSVRVTYPKGTKLNKKLIIYNKKKKATKKNLKNITGKAGTTSLKSDGFVISGSNGLKFKNPFPAGTRSFSISTKSSALLPSYKTFCGDITKKKYKVAKKYKAALKKCQSKNVTFTFEITNVDGTAYRYNYVAPAGSKFFK